MDSDFSVFGRVIDGTNVVDLIGSVDTYSERPKTDVTVIKAEFIK